MSKPSCNTTYVQQTGSVSAPLSSTANINVPNTASGALANKQVCIIDCVTVTIQNGTTAGNFGVQIQSSLGSIPFWSFYGTLAAGANDTLFTPFPYGLPLMAMAAPAITNFTGEYVGNTGTTVVQNLPVLAITATAADMNTEVILTYHWELTTDRKPF